MKYFFIGLGVFVLILVSGLIGFYNSMVGLDETLKSMDSQVNNMYERRVDLVPQVAAVVKKYAEYEKGTLEGVTRLREASNNLANLGDLAAQGKVNTQEYSNLLASTMSSLKVTVEAYPQLKADTQFTNLFTTLEGSENRIRVAIKDYNDNIVSYNLKARSIPYGFFFSKMFGFNEKERINPPEGKEIKAVPDVDNLLTPTTGTGK
ncbi:MAG: LemA family protein [Candidatus Gracilibacteria bacterium]|nr:LemA family protein [Candidatus Gracilibacteria bacterium]MDD3120145.1 LemA family protein [Candidatus Gracilibacteria bacterium]MDD4530361.1 LemA family protein [Candidatus Gracilibacteria bacterium]